MRREVPGSLPRTDCHRHAHSIVRGTPNPRQVEGPMQERDHSLDNPTGLGALVDEHCTDPTDTTRAGRLLWCPPPPAEQNEVMCVGDGSVPHASTGTAFDGTRCTPETPRRVPMPAGTGDARVPVGRLPGQPGYPDLRLSSTYLDAQFTATTTRRRGSSYRSIRWWRRPRSHMGMPATTPSTKPALPVSVGSG